MQIYLFVFCRRSSRRPSQWWDRTPSASSVHGSDGARFSPRLVDVKRASAGFGDDDRARARSMTDALQKPRVGRRNAGEIVPLKVSLFIWSLLELPSIVVNPRLFLNVKMVIGLAPSVTGIGHYITGSFIMGFFFG